MASDEHAHRLIRGNLSAQGFPGMHPQDPDGGWRL